MERKNLRSLLTKLEISCSTCSSERKSRSTCREQKEMSIILNMHLRSIFAIYQIRHRILQTLSTWVNLCNNCPPFARFISTENAYKTVFPNKKVIVILQHSDYHSNSFIFFFSFIYCIYLFLAALDLPAPGLEPVSPALAGGFLTTAPPGKSQ